MVVDSGPKPAACKGVATVPSSPAISPATSGDIVRSSESLQGETTEAAAASVPDPSTGGWSPLIIRLPVELDVAIPVRGFKVRNLVALGKGTVVESQWGHAEDVPLAAPGAQLAWCEFEVIETRLAVRVTRLA